MVQRRKFRLSEMIPNAWFYKLRDMGAQGRGGGGGVGTGHHRSSSARCFKEVVQQPSWSRGSSARWNREVVKQPAEVVQEPVTPTKVSTHSPLPRRASYYYSTRDREVPPPPRSSRRRNRAGHVSAPVPVHGKEPVVDAPDNSCRRRDMCIQSGGGKGPRRPAVTGPPDDGLNVVKVIASETEIIIDLRLRDEDAPERRLRPIVTRQARRHPEPDGSHVDLADVTVRDEETPERRRLRSMATRPARRLPEPNEPEGRPVGLGDMTARASTASEKSSVSKPRRSSASSSSGRRRLKTRVNSPRLAATARRGKPPARDSTAPAIVDSYAVVKLSRDPRKDFRESMEEMICAKGIRDAGDLEDLLACYLALNDTVHHDLIIEVFEQIWMSLSSAKP